MTVLYRGLAEVGGLLLVNRLREVMACQGLAVIVVLSLADAGCGSSAGALTAGPAVDRADAGSAAEEPTSARSDAGSTVSATSGDAASGHRFSVTPSDQTLVLSGTNPAPITFSVSDDGAVVDAPQFYIDRPDLGAIDRNTGVFTPTGAAGHVLVTVTSRDGYATTTLTVTVDKTANGDDERDMIAGGAGGFGGVGGEGGGTPIDDARTRDALDATATADLGLSWLYPYDRTVWPRGLAAPILAWRSTQAALGVRIRVEVDDVYSHTSYLGRPSALLAGRAFTHVPMPAGVWREASASGRTMRVSLTIVADDGHGGLQTLRPQADVTWTIAPAALKGTVYYNSYGTALAKNYDGARGGDGRFGGAVLAVRGDSYAPTLVAGSTTSDHSGCRVCHTVSGDGSTLLTQREASNTRATSAYDLRNANAQTLLPTTDNGKYTWAALTPDGRVALGASGPPNAQSMLNVSALYDVQSGATLNSPGFAPMVTRAAMPTFSPDAALVAFNYVAGAPPAGVQAGGRTLTVMDVANTNATTYTFSNLRALYSSSATPPGWPTFVPGNSGIVFQRELAAGTYGDTFTTRQGAQGDLWWTDLSGSAHALDNANGVAGLPQSALHPNDTLLNYEPTASPILSGGYAWVIFTSRRQYADIATRAPYESDPRDYDLTEGNANGPTTKKLWVFAVDVPPVPGSDPSHPAFYLPSQELFAGNSRGFWVPDACKSEGVGCVSGDECCGGFCYGATEFGDPICQISPPPTTCQIKYVTEFGDPICFDSNPAGSCAREFDACTSSADCCSDGTLSCIAGRCATLTLH